MPTNKANAYINLVHCENSYHLLNGLQITNLIHCIYSFYNLVKFVFNPEPKYSFKLL